MSEVRVVEQVEYFGAKFNKLVLRKHRSLNDREVNVIESRTNHDVATEITKASYRNDKWSNVEPAIGRSQNRDWTSGIGPDSVVRAGKGSIVYYYCHGVTRLRLDNRGNLPTFRELIAVERKLVETAENEPVTSV